MRPVPPAVLSLIHEFEQGPKGGFAAKAYNDPAGIPTIGWGHRIVPGDLLSGATITEAEADATAMQDLEHAANAICLILGDAVTKLSDNQYAALIDFTFNLGASRFGGSTLCKLIKEGDLTSAAGEFGKWVYVAGQVSAGLQRRRAAEKALWQT